MKNPAPLTNGTRKRWTTTISAPSRQRTEEAPLSTASTTSTTTAVFRMWEDAAPCGVLTLPAQPLIPSPTVSGPGIPVLATLGYLHTHGAGLHSTTAVGIIVRVAAGAGSQAASGPASPTIRPLLIPPDARPARGLRVLRLPASPRWSSSITNPLPSRGYPHHPTPSSSTKTPRVLECLANPSAT